MKLQKGILIGRAIKRLMSILVSISMVAAFLPLSVETASADTIFTEYQPVVNEVIDASGFKHPGVGLTKDILENMRTQVREQKEPWNTYFNQMLLSSAASRTVTSSNKSSTDPTKPASDAFNSQGFNSRFIQDGLKAYTQAILYYITGDEVYRANAMGIIRIWSQMDPDKYAYFVDSHIHTGIPLNRMVAASEILRYTSTQLPELQWTDQDTADFTDNLITPVIETFQHHNGYFMNQHLYPLIGAMSGYIFTGNRDRYLEGVEWFTVNKTAVDQGQNGSIKQLFRLVDTNILTGEPVDPPRVQHVEMGRDQAHGAGDITNADLLSRLLLAQGTKVDPVDGTVSTAPNAVNPYEFLNDRILDAADYFARFMLGYDTPWTPVAAHTDAAGTPTIVYKELSEQYRGRLTQNTWELIYYYKYVAGINIEERAPHLTQMFAKRVSYNWDGVDGGGDFWMFIPKAAEAEGTKYLVKPITEPYREIEDRYTAFDPNTATMQEGTVSYVRFQATKEGSKIALIGSGTGEKTIGFKIRTNGTAQLEIVRGINDTLTLPDTKGQWRYVTYTMNNYQGMGDLVYFLVKGAGTTVDMDHIHVKAGTQLTPPVFTAGNADVKWFTYAGSEATIHYDFSATDAGSADVVTYQIDHKPEGAFLNESTGVFSWRPTQAGTYSFVVSASDGTSVSTKDVQVVVANDCQSAVDAVIAPYHANTSYVTSTLEHYQTVYHEVMSLISSASDEVFYSKLSELNGAVEGLRELTPLREDGSMDYTNMFVTSTFGNQIPNILDNYAGSFSVYTSAKNLTHTMDFGPNYKVSADAFELQVRASFPERIGGVAFFGSNDMETWRRLTPGTTTVTEELQRLEVHEELKQTPFRFLKMQMIEPSSTMLEIAEFRIYGERHETLNKLESVSISSEQSLKNRIVPGNTVKLSFQSTEAIHNVKVLIQDQEVPANTMDNLNWTAVLVTDQNIAPGNVKFSIKYQTTAGVNAAETIFTTDGTSLFIADQTGYLSNVLDMANLIDSSGRNPADLLATAKLLFDNNLGTVTDFRLNGSGSGAYLTFDFKEGGQALLSKVEVIARQDGYSSRINGTVVQGSNDNVTWTTISNTAGNTAEWQSLTINSNVPYRYIRMTNGNNWFGNMAELRLYGNVQILSKIDSVSMSSEQSIRGRIVPGNTVKLAFKSTEQIQNVKVKIQGQDAAVSTADQFNWTAAAGMNPDVSSGPVNFSIQYQTSEGVDGPEKTVTTDGSKLYMADESDVIRNVTGIAVLMESTTGRSAAATLSQANNLFDGNAGSISDFRNGSSSGWGSCITFDFKEGNRVSLTAVELLARQDNNYARIGGAVIQGSNDNTSWTDLTSAALKTMDWQTLSVTGSIPYRYIRISNPNQWFGNMAEVRFHGSVKPADVTPPVTTDDAPRGWANGDTKVSFQAVDADSGVSATYYTVDGGAPQTGNEVTLTTEGTHTLVYWSVDGAGNAETAHTVTVNLDKTAPALTVQLDQTAIWPANHKMVTVNADLNSSDDASGIESVVLTSITMNQEDSGEGDIEASIGMEASTFSLRAEKSRIYTITYTATDKAGNQTVAAVTVVVPHDQSGEQ